MATLTRFVAFVSCLGISGCTGALAGGTIDLQRPRVFAFITVTVVDSRRYGPESELAGATVRAITRDGGIIDCPPVLTDEHGVARLTVTWDDRHPSRVWIAVTHPTFAPLTAQYIDLVQGHSYTATVPMTPWPIEANR